VEVTRAAILLVFAGLGIRAAHLSVFDQRGAAQGDAQSLRTLVLPPARGAIVDRSGAELALSVEAPSVYAIASELDDVDATARSLARLLHLEAGPLRDRLRAHPGFQFVKRWVSDTEAQAVEKLGYGGLGIVKEPRRIYPHRTLAGRTIGFANIDARGVRGIEQQEDEWLRGTTRRLPVERDGGGRLMLVRGGATWGTAGGDVALTLDATLQSEAERALKEAVTATGARGGLALAMDVHSGEILTLAESPTLDPNRFRTLAYASTRSTAFLDAVEPGSTLKAFLVAAALETGAIAPTQLFDCEEGTFRIPGKTIRDTHPHGLLDTGGVLRVSSNIGAVKIAQALGRSAHHEMLRRFGFGESTGSGFPDESAGVVRPWRRWRPVDHATIAFGQGVSVTAVQLAAAGAVLANGGEWVRPRLVAARRAADGAWRPTRREVVRRVVSPETARMVVDMLESVVSGQGTGRRAALRGLPVAGKTGTAQKFDRETGGYASDRFRAWFVGIVPADDPELVIVTELDEPRRPHHTGGASAAPLFARIAASQLARRGVFPDALPAEPETRTVEKAPPAPPPVAAAPPASGARPAADREPPVRVAVAARRPTPAKPAARPSPAPTPTAPEPPSEPAPAKPGRATPAHPPVRVASFGGRYLLPDLLGLTRSQVTQVTDGTGIRLQALGTGRALRQVPPAGTIVSPGDAVRVEFGEGADPPDAARRVPRRGS
jgi:cell division protein FtsI (penicillin-binding protein 3)